MDAIDAIDDLKIIFTKTLADTNGRIINEMIDDYVAANGHKAIAFTSMGQLRYISALEYVDVVAGNSSSGVIETPSFKVPTLNIGKREEGRIMADNVICVEQDTDAIKSAFMVALSSEFKESLSDMTNPYEKAGTSTNIAEILEKYQLAGSTMKDFYDL